MNLKSRLAATSKLWFPAGTLPTPGGIRPQGRTLTPRVWLVAERGHRARAVTTPSDGELIWLRIETHPLSFMKKMDALRASR